MGKFAIEKKYVKLGEEEYALEPLSGKFLKIVYRVLSKLSPKEDEKNLSEEEQTTLMLEKLDDQTVDDLHSLVFETLKQSYPDEKEEDLSKFASQHLQKLFPIIIELNLGVK